MTSYGRENLPLYFFPGFPLEFTPEKSRAGMASWALLGAVMKDYKEKEGRIG